MAEVERLQAGERLGDWILVSHLGEGGMGSVWRCRHVRLEGIEAAVKVLRPDSQVPQAAERFEREVRALYGLRHPAIVRVLGFGEQEGAWWLAMELVQGETLSSRLARGPMPAEQARAAFAALADGLAHAHARGVAHRDIKPANIMLDDSGAPVLVDFGIALDDSRTRLTTRGVVPGTPAYMAPEVFAMDGGSAEAGDIYALGQVLCEALTGRAAFDEPEHMSGGQRLVWLMSAKGRQVSLDPGPEVAEDLRGLVRHATAMDPKLRLASAVELARRLQLPPTPAGGEGARSAPPIPQGLPRQRGWWVVLPASVLLLGGCAVAALLAWVLWPPSPGPGEVDTDPSGVTDVADSDLPDTDLPDTDLPDTDLPDTDAVDTDADTVGLRVADTEPVRSEVVAGATTRVPKPTGPCPSVAACLELTENYGLGRGVAQDVKQAARFREEACRLGSAQACYDTAWRVSAGQHGYDTRDPVASLAWFDRACQAGDGASCERLGSLLAVGVQVPQDGPRAHAAYRAACDLDDGKSCYMAGTGPVASAVPEPAEACALFERSCTLGYATGCAAIAECLRKGSTGSIDLPTAARRLSRACDLGNAFSCRRMGQWSAAGNGVAGGPTAAAWFERARAALGAKCDAGGLLSALPCSELGEMARDGEGGPVDIEAARTWFTQACERGHTPACGYRARLP